MQEYQHCIERHGIDSLRRFLGTRLKDVHEDYNTGIDVLIDDQPYDLKVTNLPFVDYLKKYKGSWYCPLELHPDIPYLIVQQRENRLICFKVLKSRVLRETDKPGKLKKCHPRDGNLHICVDISGLLDCPEFVFNV